MLKKIELKYRIFIFVVPIIVVLDQWTKYLIQKNFFYGQSMTIIEHYFNLVYVRNTGAAFSILQNADATFRDPFLLAVPVVALVIIQIFFLKLPNHQRMVALALSLIAGGAIGNLIDRFRFGYVIDFLDFHWKEFYHWPSFNVADSSIVVGVSMIFLDAWLERSREGTEQADSGSPPAQS